MTRKIQRREFLEVAGISAAGVALAGCSGSGAHGGGAQQKALKGPFRSSAVPDTPPAPTNPSAASTGGTVPGPPGYSLPLAPPGSVTFTYAGPDNGYAPRSMTQGLAVWKEIEKRTGINVKWQVAAGAQYSDSMAPRLGSGQKLPDLLSLPQGWDPVRAGTEGLVVPLSDYIDKKNTPNIVRFFEQFPEIRKLSTAPDGKIYALGAVVTDAAYSDPYGLIIRQDWLDKLNLQEPATLDDWYQVLKAFKTQNPNGDGKHDEVPFISASQSSATEPLAPLYPFASGMGLHLQYSGGTYVQDSGKVYYEWTDPRMRDLLTWFNKLYREKLLDPDFYNSSPEDAVQKVTRDLAGSAGDFSNRTVQYNKAQETAGHKKVNWVTVKPPTYDQVKNRYYEIYGPLSGWGSVSKDCKNPKLATQWLDYIWASDEGNTLTTYGVEGVTYTVSADKRFHFTKWVTDNPQGLDPNSALRYHGSLPYTTPWVRAEKGMLSEFSWDTTRTNKRWLASANKTAPYMVPHYPTILATADESKELAGLTTDMNTYRNESVLKFVLGQKPINEQNWQEYVSTLQGMGLDRVMEIQQTQYDRYQHAK